MKDTITDRSLDQFKSSQTGPWLESKGKGKVDRTSPVALVAGSEGLGAGEVQELRAHLRVCSDGERSSRRGLVSEEERVVAGELFGGGARRCSGEGN